MDVLIVGPAGSGKSLLTREFGQYLEMNYSVAFINLDSGTIQTPYNPDFDIREYYTLEEIMAEEELGPNGATLEAVDRLREIDIPRFQDDFVLIDTPGQLEPFVFRGGAEYFRGITDNTIFLMDGTAPLNTFPSQYLYSLTTQYAIQSPMLTAINKTDLLSEETLSQVERMARDPRIMAGLQDTGMRTQVNLDIADLIMEMHMGSAQIPLISAKERKGFENLATQLIETARTEKTPGSGLPTPRD